MFWMREGRKESREGQEGEKSILHVAQEQSFTRTFSRVGGQGEACDGIARFAPGSSSDNHRGLSLLHCLLRVGEASRGQGQVL